MNITITGRLGSGKSTICKMIQENYGYEIYSTGTIQRQVADEKGVTTLELNKMMEIDHSLDDEIDAATTRIAREKKDEKVIFDSRMAWHFVEDSFRIFLTVDPTVAAQRVMSDPTRGRESYDSVEEAREALIERSRLEQARFLRLYGVDYCDFKNFNLVVDTSRRTPAEVAEAIWNGYAAFCADPVANAHVELL